MEVRLHARITEATRRGEGVLVKISDLPRERDTKCNSEPELLVCANRRADCSFDDEELHAQVLWIPVRASGRIVCGDAAFHRIPVETSHSRVVCTVSRFSIQAGSEHDAWRNATRESFVGARIRKLELVNGETLESVIIKKVEDDRVTFDLSDGTTKVVSCSNLPILFLRRIAHEPTIIEEADTL